MKNKILIGAFIILVLIGIWMQIKSTEIGKKHFDVFNLAEIDTTIESTEKAFKGTKIKLADGRQFVFFPFTDQILNNSSIFNFTAQKVTD